MNTLELANYILYQYPGTTHLKLQKLLYYLKVWGTIAGDRLVESDFEKWIYGPVSPVIYQEYRQYGANPIPSPGNPPHFQHQTTKDLVDFILEAYAPHQAFDLSAMTHRELPWNKIANNDIITESQIQEVYALLPFARNFNPFDPERKPYYVVQSNGWYAYTMDMNAEDIQRSTRFPSYAEYKESQKEVENLLLEIL